MASLDLINNFAITLITLVFMTIKSVNYSLMAVNCRGKISLNLSSYARQEKFAISSHTFKNSKMK